MKPGGYTKWARKTVESDVFYWKPAEWFKIWFYIVNAVNYQDNKLFNRGEQFLTREKIAEGTKTSINQVTEFVRWAKKEKMCTTQKTTRGMVIKVLNYAKYQDLDEYYKTTRKPISKQHINNTINKETKKTKEVVYPSNTLEIAKIIGQEPTEGLDRYLNDTYKDYVFKAFTEYFVEKMVNDYKKKPTIAAWMNWVRRGIPNGEIPRRDK